MKIIGIYLCLALSSCSSNQAGWISDGIPMLRNAYTVGKIWQCHKAEYDGSGNYISESSLSSLGLSVNPDSRQLSVYYAGHSYHSIPYDNYDAGGELVNDNVGSWLLGKYIRDFPAIIYRRFNSNGYIHAELEAKQYRCRSVELSLAVIDGKTPTGY